MVYLIFKVMQLKISNFFRYGKKSLTYAQTINVSKNSPSFLFKSIATPHWLFVQVSLGTAANETNPVVQGHVSNNQSEVIICNALIIICHDPLPTPRRGSHVKSGKTHPQSSRYTPSQCKKRLMHWAFIIRSQLFKEISKADLK